MPGLVPVWQIQLSKEEKFSDSGKALLPEPTKCSNKISGTYSLLLFFNIKHKRQKGHTKRKHAEDLHDCSKFDGSEEAAHKLCQKPGDHKWMISSTLSS